MKKSVIFIVIGILSALIICTAVYLFTLHPAGSFIDSDFPTDKEIMQLNYFIEEDGYWMDSGAKNETSVFMRDAGISVSGTIESGEFVIELVSEDGKVLFHEVLNKSSSCEFSRNFGDLGYSFYLKTGVDKEYQFSGNIEVKVSYKARGYEKLHAYFGS